MSKAVLISIQPKWCELIASGRKTIEVRKTKPKLQPPFKCYIYCIEEKRLLRKFNKGERIDDNNFFDRHVFARQNTWIKGHFNPNKKVIGEFVCDAIISHCEMVNADIAEYQGCIKREVLYEYSGGKELYGWHISDLVIYDKPKELSEFNHCGANYHINPPVTRPPQSWCYVEENHDR